MGTRGGRLTAAIVGLAGAVCLAPASAGAYSYVQMAGEPGDFISQGQSLRATTRERPPFDNWSSAGELRMRVNGESQQPWYIVQFTAPEGEALQVGRTYANAQRSGYADPGRAGLYVQYDGRACNKVSGSFRVLDMVAGPDNKVIRFRVTFEQHCEEAAPALRGEAVLNYPEDGSDPLAPPPAAPGTGAPRDVTRPGLSRFGLSRSVFRAARSGPALAVRRPAVGTKLRFRLSEAATVRLAVQRRVKTRRGGRRWKTLKGSATLAGRVGANAFTFRGRLAGRRLAAGRYRLLARAQDPSRNRSKLHSVRFRVVR